MDKKMKTIVLALPLIALTACQSTQEIALDDPRRAEADARIANTAAGASGIAGIAIIGETRDRNSINIKIDSRYSTPTEIAAAPDKVCAFLNGTVVSSRNEGTPSGNFDLEPEFIRYLYIECSV